MLMFGLDTLIAVMFATLLASNIWCWSINKMILNIFLLHDNMVRFCAKKNLSTTNRLFFKWYPPYNRCDAKCG